MHDVGNERPDRYEAPELALLLGLIMAADDASPDLARGVAGVSRADRLRPGIVGGHGVEGPADADELEQPW